MKKHILILILLCLALSLHAHFDIGINDNTKGDDSGRTEQRYWYSNNGLGNDQDWNITSSFGIAMLSTQVSHPFGFTVNPKSLFLTSLAGSNSTVSIVSTATWSAISNQTWLTVTPSSGNGNQQLTLTFTANNGSSARTATVTVSSAGVTSQTITVTQETGQVSDTKTVTIPSCGLATALTQNEKNTIINLTVIGNLCSGDFATMKSMPMLEMLNLSGATVSSPSNWIPAFALSNTKLKSIIFPKSITHIDNSAFSGCTGLDSITIPASVTAIKDSAFIGCTSLGELTIPATVASIGKDAFSGCSGLTVVTTPMANDVNGNSIFEGCDQLFYIVIPEGKTSIVQNDFSGLSGLTSIIIPESVTSIGDKAFADCSGLSSINIPLGVNYLGQGAFSGCSNLAYIKIPESITSIGYKTFLNCSNLSSVDLPPSILSIGYQTFDGCNSLYSIDIPASVTYIPTHAFRNCNSLATFEIPANVSSIGQGAFSDCSGLTSMIVNSSVPVNLANSPDVFTGVDKTNCTLYIPTGSKAAYQSANQWKDFLNIIEGNGFWLSTKEIEFYADYDISTLNIISKHAWAARSDQTWLQLSPTAGNASEIITMNADINPSTIARTAIVTISAIGFPDQTIAITQDGGIVILSVDYNYNQIGKEANSSYLFKVFTNSNISWSAACDQPWISINPATGTGIDTVTLVAEANHTKQTRKANITVTVPGVPSQTFAVTQEVGDGTGFAALSSETIIISPNPVTNGFIVSGLEEKAIICITDLNGRLLLTKQILGNEKIPVHSLSSGLYFVKVITDAGTIKRKIVKK